MIRKAILVLLALVAAVVAAIAYVAARVADDDWGRT